MHPINFCPLIVGFNEISELMLEDLAVKAAMHQVWKPSRPTRLLLMENQTMTVVCRKHSPKPHSCLFTFLMSHVCF